MPDRASTQIGVVGLYDNPDDLILAAETVRDSGCSNWDCHTPYPVHGLDRAMGLRDSPMPYITLTAGAMGLITAVMLTGGLSALHYPIRVGGKELFSWQAFVPIYFELFVLAAAVATFFGVIALCRLGRWHSPLHDSGVMREITGNQFAIAITTDELHETADQLRDILDGARCTDIRPLIEFDEAEGAFI